MTAVAQTFDQEAELVAAQAARKRALSWTPAVYGCIVKVSADLARDGIAKDSKNLQQGYAFRGIDAVMNALAPALVRHGLVILPRCLSRVMVERESRGGGPLFSVTVEAEFDFVCAADGSTHTVRMYGEAMDSADKATNKAMSAAYKYAAFQTFCIPTEGDADAETPEAVIQIEHPPGRDTQPAAPPVPRAPLSPAAATGETRGPSQPSGAAPPAAAALAAGTVRIAKVDATTTKNPKVTKYLITTSTGETYSTIKDKAAKLAEDCQAQGLPVRIAGTPTKWGLDLDVLEVIEDIPF